jgi:hypothetical protein
MVIAPSPAVQNPRSQLAPGPAANRALTKLHQAERLRAEAIADLAYADSNEIAAVRGYLSPARMIAYETRVSDTDAHQLARLAQFIGRHGATGNALEQGEISLAQASCLASAAERLHDEYDRDEDELLNACLTRDVTELNRFIAQWRWRNDREASQNDAERSWNNRGVTMAERFDGSGSAHADLDAEGFATLAAALETRPDPVDGLDEPRSLKQRRADRLVEICDNTLHGSPQPTFEGLQPALCDGDGDGGCEAHPGSQSGFDDRFDVIGTAPEWMDPAEMAAHGRSSRSTTDVIIDLETLLGVDPADTASVENLRAELANGTPLPTQEWERLACDPSIRRMLTVGKSIIIDYGRATPVISSHLRNLVKERDRHSQFRGCNVGANHCDVHHIVAWHDGGETSEWNLVAICRRHHRMIHLDGWTITRHSDGSLETCSP